MKNIKPIEINSDSTEIELEDIVQTVVLDDLKLYIRKRYLIGELDCPKTHAYANSKLQMLCDELQCRGYKVLDLDEIAEKIRKNWEDFFTSELKKRTAKYTHEISVLSKRCNELKHGKENKE